VIEGADEVPEEGEKKENIITKQVATELHTEKGKEVVAELVPPNETTSEALIRRSTITTTTASATSVIASKSNRDEILDEDEELDEEDDEVFWDCSSETPRRRRRRGHLPSSSLEATLKSLQETTERIERQSQLISQRLSALEEKLQRSKSGQEGEGLISITNLSWSSVAFLVAWPIVSYVAIDYFSSKANRKR